MIPAKKCMTPTKKILLGIVGVVALGIAALGVVALWWHSESKSVKEVPVAVSTAHPAASTHAATDAMPTQKVDSVEVMVERLRARLEKEPNDVDGWVLLGRSYHYLERWDDAKAAFAKARALGYQGDAETAEAGNASSAMNATTSAADSANDAVFSDISRVAPNNAGSRNDNADAAASDSARVRAAVDVTPELRAKFAPGTTVFVFARAAQGPRMPLAVVRKTLSELPAEIDLDDSLAMMPEAKISAAQTIVLGARIAPSGNPIAQPGDVEVLSAPLSDWRGQRVSLLLKHQ